MLTDHAHILPDIDIQAQAVAEWLIERVALTPAHRSCAMAITGGDSPLPLYRLLACPEYAARLDWSRIQIFWTDERVVPYDHSESNYGAARKALLQHLALPPGHVHPMPVNGTPEHGAQDYARRLQAYYGAPRLLPDTPLFDIVLLGIGDDGHIGSLFPGSPGLANTVDWAVGVSGYRPEDRISLTLPILSSGRATAFIVSGAGKRAILARVARGEPDLPAVQLRPQGECHWFLDRDAAGGLA